MTFITVGPFLTSLWIFLSEVFPLAKKVFLGSQHKLRSRNFWVALQLLLTTLGKNSRLLFTCVNLKPSFSFSGKLSVIDPSRWCEVLVIYCCRLTPTEHSERSWTLFWKGAPIIALWGSSLEKFLGTKEGLVCPPCILSKGQGRGTHRGMGAHTAMSLWNTVSACQHQRSF